jgi:hypothetical protein
MAFSTNRPTRQSKRISELAGEIIDEYTWDKHRRDSSPAQSRIPNRDIIHIAQRAMPRTCSTENNGLSDSPVPKSGMPPTSARTASRSLQ